MSTSSRQLGAMLDGYMDEKDTIAVIFPIINHYTGETEEGTLVEIHKFNFDGLNNDSDCANTKDHWMESDSSDSQALIECAERNIPAIRIDRFSGTFKLDDTDDKYDLLDTWIFPHMDGGRDLLDTNVDRRILYASCDVADVIKETYLSFKDGFHSSYTTQIDENGCHKANSPIFYITRDDWILSCWEEFSPDEVLW